MFGHPPIPLRRVEIQFVEAALGNGCLFDQLRNVGFDRRMLLQISLRGVLRLLQEGVAVLGGLGIVVQLLQVPRKTGILLFSKGVQQAIVLLLVLLRPVQTSRSKVVERFVHRLFAIGRGLFLLRDGDGGRQSQKLKMRFYKRITKRVDRAAMEHRQAVDGVHKTASGIARRLFNLFDQLLGKTAFHLLRRRLGKGEHHDVFKLDAPFHDQIYDARDHRRGLTRAGGSGDNHLALGALYRFFLHLSRHRLPPFA